MIGISGHYGYQSDRSFYERGYDGDMRYTATQFGGNLYGFDLPNSMTRTGFAATYGKMRFTPRHVAGARETERRLWQTAAYASWRHQSGAYIDAVAAHGGFGGDVVTAARGKTAKLGGRSFSTSITAGLPVAFKRLDGHWSRRRRSSTSN